MNIINKTFITTIAAMCDLFPACTIKYYDTNKLLNDYKTEGFLDRDHFQVVITGTPDKESRGLVFKRESALRVAKSRMEDVVIDKLVSYSVDYQVKELHLKDADDILNMDEIKRSLKIEMCEYFKYGCIAFEYYNEDCTAVLVYRIFKDELVEDLESVKSEFKIKKQN